MTSILEVEAKVEPKSSDTRINELELDIRKQMKYLQKNNVANLCQIATTNSQRDAGYTTFRKVS